MLDFEENVTAGNCIPKFLQQFFIRFLPYMGFRNENLLY